MKKLLSIVSCLNVFLAHEAALAGSPRQVIDKNVYIFGGESDSLAENGSILVEGNLIKAIGNDLNAVSATMVDGGAGTRHGVICKNTLP
jgi:hypothetical protein